MHRSLQTARARAHARSDRFVKAAIRLLQEKGNIDFTVQDVVDRSKMSIRTFYKYFESKEDLLVAVYETVVAHEAVPRLRKRIDKHRDPMLRLRAYIEGLTELAAEVSDNPERPRAVNDAAQSREQMDEPAQFFAAVRNASHSFGGATNATMSRCPSHHCVKAAVHSLARSNA